MRIALIEDEKRMAQALCEILRQENMMWITTEMDWTVCCPSLGKTAQKGRAAKSAARPNLFGDLTFFWRRALPDRLRWFPGSGGPD